MKGKPESCRVRGTRIEFSSAGYGPYRPMGPTIRSDGGSSGSSDSDSNVGQPLHIADVDPEQDDDDPPPPQFSPDSIDGGDDEDGDDNDDGGANDSGDDNAPPLPPSSMVSLPGGSRLTSGSARARTLSDATLFPTRGHRSM